MKRIPLFVPNLKALSDVLARVPTPALYLCAAAVALIDHELLAIVYLALGLKGFRNAHR